MPSIVRRGPVRLWSRLARLAIFAFAGFCRVLIVALAAGLGAVPPRPSLVRHEDPTTQIDEDDAP